MKILAGSQATREKVQSQVNMRVGDHDHICMVVGMTTCGIAVGARPVLNTLANEVQERGSANKISATQTNCIGLCRYEPIMEVVEPGKNKITYVKMNADKALEVVEHHLVDGHSVEKYAMDVAGPK